MHQTSRHPLTRRAFLRGAGAVAALPFLEQLALPAPSAKVPMRMGIVTVTGGTVLESWKPKETGALQKLPSILRPLEGVRDELLVLSGLSQNGRSDGGLNAHEHCSLMHLTGCDVVRKVNGKLVAGESIDQAAARAVGGNTLLPSLEIGLAGHENKYSFRSADAPVPFEANPRLVFDRMFRGRTPVAPNWVTRGRGIPLASGPAKPNIDRSVADLIREEASDLRRDLGHGDRHRLDEYLECVRALEKRIDFVEKRQRQEALDALNPGPSRVSLPAGLPEANVPIWKITNPIYRDPENHEQYIRLMYDLMALAYQTDTTRVATFACGSDEANFPGVITVGYERHCHTLEHQGNASRPEDADPIAREACRQIHQWYTKLFAEFVAKLKAIDEGGSSLLDNTLLLYTSYMADGGHGTHDYPAVLVGKAGGTLKTGRHLAFKPRTPVSNLYVEMLDRMGVPVKKFGESHTSEFRGYDGRLPGLGA